MGINLDGIMDLLTSCCDAFSEDCNLYVPLDFLSERDTNF